jgi:hypothetical protein
MRRREDIGMLPKKKSRGGLFCLIVGAKVCTYVNFPSLPSLPEWRGRDGAEDIWNKLIYLPVEGEVWMIESKNQQWESPLLGWIFWDSKICYKKFSHLSSLVCGYINKCNASTQGELFKLLDSMTGCFLQFKCSLIRRGNWGLYRIQALVNSISNFRQRIWTVRIVSREIPTS